ncbi:adenylyltransferase/cytidyltransferase family protein [Candidatus Saccharibacteria bacterium]|nr:adenylyltransferase/cytidyltransferase family protein [Candidatus Saccharibacteria bacterium]
MKSRIGIYSGTFDPVHDGHIAFANAALKQCNLDKIFFLVEPRPRRKQGVKAFEHRTEMVRLAIKNEHSLGSIVLNQQRFTPADTLPLLTERFKGADLYMLIGDDMLDHLAGWPHVECLLQSVIASAKQIPDFSNHPLWPKTAFPRSTYLRICLSRKSQFLAQRSLLQKPTNLFCGGYSFGIYGETF